MKVARSRKELDEALLPLRQEGIGFVPTMGYLHDGHVSLLRAAREDGPVVLSIFVNPRQFGVGEDLDRYPRDEAGDLAKAREAGVDVVFLPGVEEVYPPGYQTEVHVRPLEEIHEGRFRPGHLTGVATVLARLFGVIRPERAYFGQKDFQQSVLVKRMVEDLALGLKIFVCPTVREEDGLAMSSRNVYLLPRERAEAPRIRKTLLFADRLFRDGEREASRLVGRASAELSRIPGFRLQYLTLADSVTLAEKAFADTGDVLLTAGFFGSTRLIDNQVLGLDPEPPA